MKAIFFALSALFFAVDANADLECVAKKGKFNMVLECPDGRTGVVDKIIPTNEIINISYRVDLKNAPSKNITVTGDELKELLKGQYDRHASYPLKEKVALFLNRKLKTNLKAADILNISPEKAKVSPSIKLYDGLVENGKTYIPKKPAGSGSDEVDAVPIKATRRVPSTNLPSGTGSRQ